MASRLGLEVRDPQAILVRVSRPIVRWKEDELSRVLAIEKGAANVLKFGRIELASSCMPRRSAIRCKYAGYT